MCSRLMKPFSMCGMPRAVCSGDGVHFETDRAKSQERHLMTCKEGYPTWAYDCSVSLNKQFIKIVGAFRGTTNDKTMSRSSPLITSLGTDPLLSHRVYTLMASKHPPNGTFVMKGVHGIVDGGYHKWPTTIAGPKPDDAPTVVLAKYG